MAKRRDIVIGAFILFAFVGFVFFAVVALIGLSSETDYAFPALGKRVAIVDVTGPIYSSKGVVRQLKRYIDDSSIPAILININSPGGGVAASQEIYSAIQRARDKGKIVVASMSTVAASGGYYIAMAADTVVANPGSLTGSIGVIIEYQTWDELAKKVGIQSHTIKSGELKAVGSPWHEPTGDELAHLQSVINDSYEQFLEVVANGRDMEIDSVRPLADGRIYTGRQAWERNLVDVLGDMDDALDIAAEMAEMDSPPNVVKEMPRRRTTIWDMIGTKILGYVPGGGPDQFAGPRLMFMYR